MFSSLQTQRSGAMQEYNRNEGNGRTQHPPLQLILIALKTNPAGMSFFHHIFLYCNPNYVQELLSNGLSTLVLHKHTLNAY